MGVGILNGVGIGVRMRIRMGMKVGLMLMGLWRCGGGRRRGRGFRFRSGGLWKRRSIIVLLQAIIQLTQSVIGSSGGLTLLLYCGLRGGFWLWSCGFRLGSGGGHLLVGMMRLILGGQVGLRQMRIIGSLLFAVKRGIDLLFSLVERQLSVTQRQQLELKCMLS